MYDYDAVLEMWKLRRKTVVQIKDDAFSAMDSISVLNCLTDLNRAFDYLLIQEDSSVLVFRNC